uniref:Disease resistance protein RPM1 n=1 Tax=Aegilops tauschii TaxID=37682 RepID=M8BW38_AEGTA
MPLLIRPRFEKVFGRTINLDEQYPTLIEQANLILKKCNGLPLAIVTIGGFLANQPKIAFQWRKLNEHISAELAMNPELGTIKTVLMRSYDGLPYHLKSCFLYMPIFPEDYRVGRGRLVRRWTAEGYSREVRGKSAVQIADSYFMELMSRSMILPSEKSIHSTKGIDSCQVHDLIREIGISKSMEENLVFTLEEGCISNSQATVRHLAINGNWKGDKSEFESIVDMLRLRSLTVFGQWKSFFISDKMSMLRVLDLEDTKDLRHHHLKHIWKLLHLRYLSRIRYLPLRACPTIFDLPDSLGNLRQLETLDVRGTGILKLPKSIIKLQKLNHLRAGIIPAYEDFVSWEQAVGDGMSHRDVCAMFCCCILPILATRLDAHGVLVPSGMTKLKALHTLGVVNIGRGKVILQDIKGLTRLRKLGVTGVNKENGQELCSAIVGLRHLESLSIRSEGEPGLSGCFDGMSSPPENLQSLKLYGNLVKLPEWIQELKHLVKLKLRNSTISEHDAAIQVIGNLPNLTFLHLLEKSFKGEEVCLSLLPGTFVRLMVLELRPTLKCLKFEQGAACKLELLKFRFADINNESLLGLPSLASLKEVVLQDYFDDTGLAYLRTELAENPNRPILKRAFEVVKVV